MRAKGYAIQNPRSRGSVVATSRNRDAAIEFAGLDQLEEVIGAPATRLPMTHPLGMRHWTARSRIYEARSWLGVVTRDDDDIAAA